MPKSECVELAMTVKRKQRDNAASAPAVEAAPDDSSATNDASDVAPDTDADLVENLDRLNEAMTLFRGRIKQLTKQARKSGGGGEITIYL